METTPVSSKKHMISNGLLLGIVSILLGVILYATNNHLEPHWSLQLLGFVIFIIFVVNGLKGFKKDNGGFLKLSQALKIGLGIALISALIGALWQYVFMTVIEPDFMSQMIEIQQEAMLESNPDMTQTQIDQAMAMSEKFSGPGVAIAIQIIAGLFFGFIISLIAGLIMKKENPYENA